MKNNTRNANKIQLQQQERCAQFLTFCAFILLTLVGIMLYLAITTEYSEQKTIYFIAFVVGIIVFIIMIGLIVHQFRKASQKSSLEQAYKMAQSPSYRFAQQQQQLEQASIYRQQQHSPNDIQLQMHRN
jgi:uncharacterized membrane protein